MIMCHVCQINICLSSYQQVLNYESKLVKLFSSRGVVMSNPWDFFVKLKTIGGHAQVFGINFIVVNKSVKTLIGIKAS